MKKALFTALCAALLMSCASKRAGVVDSTINEANTLRELAKVQNFEVPASAEALITQAEKENSDRQTEKAFVLADEAVLQLQLSMLKQEQAALAAENKAASASLNSSKDSLDVYRGALNKHKNTPKEQIIK